MCAQTATTATRKSQKADRKKIKSVWQLVAHGFSIGLCVLIAGMAVVAVVIPKATGSVPLTILTSSMEPQLPPGTLIVVRPVDTTLIAHGDVITYQIRSGQPEVITHRVLGINASLSGGRTFTLKGDNNGNPDRDAVRPEQIQGKVWYSIPLLGHLSSALNGKHSAWAMPALGTLLIGYAVISALVSVIQSIHKRRRSLTENSESGGDRGRAAHV